MHEGLHPKFWGLSICEMTWFNIPSTFIKIKDHLNCFWSMFVFLGAHVHYICFHKYTPISHFIKWNELFFFNILPRLYSNIICKNVDKFFQKFEVGHTQTCTPLESNITWTSKGGYYSVLSHVKFYFQYVFVVCSYLIVSFCFFLSPSIFAIVTFRFCNVQNASSNFTMMLH